MSSRSLGQPGAGAGSVRRRSAGAARRRCPAYAGERVAAPAEQGGGARRGDPSIHAGHSLTIGYVRTVHLAASEWTAMELLANLSPARPAAGPAPAAPAARSWWWGSPCTASAWAMMVESHLGLDPWDVFHDGVAGRLPLSFGHGRDRDRPRGAAAVDPAAPDAGPRHGRQRDPHRRGHRRDARRCSTPRTPSAPARPARRRRGAQRPGRRRSTSAPSSAPARATA